MKFLVFATLAFLLLGFSANAHNECVEAAESTSTHVLLEKHKGKELSNIRVLHSGCIFEHDPKTDIQSYICGVDFSYELKGQREELSYDLVFDGQCDELYEIEER